MIPSCILRLWRKLEDDEACFILILGEITSLADWDSKLQQTMAEMFSLRSEDAAYKKISAMLSTLGDPFTRIISPKVLSISQFPCLYARFIVL